MRFSKGTLVTGFAIFSLFFGAGNLILPPYLGYTAGSNWFWVSIGFCISAVLIPLLGIFAHARVQGSMLDLANKVHPIFSIIFCALVYLVAITLPGPRTASVTYEMAIEPYFEISSLTSSAIYFGLALLFALNRSRVLNALGKYLTPLLLLILTTIICIALFAQLPPATGSQMLSPVTSGLLEGYQTFDAIGAIVIGAVVVISLNLVNPESHQVKKNLMIQAGSLAGLGLLLIYIGMIYVGSLYGSQTDLTSRTDLLAFLSYDTLGSGGRILLSILVGLACFTTAVGIVTGTADFVKGLFKNSQKAYVLTAMVAAALGVLIGQTGVAYIIAVAVPALSFIYPLVIVLIVLNLFSDRFVSILIFRLVAIVTIVFSIPDFLVALNAENYEGRFTWIPFSDYGVGWILPVLLTFVFGKSIEHFYLKSNTPKTEN
ncbi:branched-chain amino acid transport system II carrier protein [Leeuwenhoekiella sp. H156]|uniref:branched-chain amino acid transport system II carrier protein n=1 Tax=Leeuwenhoekiella sp. H156 TaxID=3450128 RepID=UPI003FA46379